MKRSSSLMLRENKILRDSLRYDVTFINEHRDVYEAVMNINDSVDNVIHRLDSFQNIIIEPNDKGIAGYPVHFRSAAMANRTFVYTGAAEGLRLSIQHIKNNLSKFGLIEYKNSIDSLLPTTTDLKNSKGAEYPWVKFFFAKTPKALLLLTTEKMKADLLMLSQDLMTHLIKYRREYMPTKQEMSSDNSMFVVKLLNGEEVTIKLDWSALSNDSIRQRFYNEISNNKLSGVIKKYGVNIGEATFNQKVAPLPPPIVKDDQMYAIVAKGPYDEMYLGLDNPISIDVYAPAGYQKEINITDGQLVTKGNKTFLRFKKEGFSKVSVYAVKGNEKKLLQERNLKIILIPDPDVYLSGYKGGVISKDIIRVANSIEVKHDGEYLTKEAYECLSFDVTLVPIDNPVGEIKARGNSGTTFSPESKEILKNIKRGDVIVLDNFKIRTAEGNIRRIPTVVYRVI